jgi:hypothetical protein
MIERDMYVAPTIPKVAHSKRRRDGIGKSAKPGISVSRFMMTEAAASANMAPKIEGKMAIACFVVILCTIMFLSNRF